MRAQYVGEALQMARMKDEMTQEEIQAWLCKKLSREVSIAEISAIEQGLREIDDELLDAWCEPLSWKKKDILEIALLCERDSGKTRDEILKDWISEMDYQIWTLRQEAQEDDNAS